MELQGGREEARRGAGIMQSPHNLCNVGQNDAPHSPPARLYFHFISPHSSKPLTSLHHHFKKIIDYLSV
jgi:hypothetical protein